MTYKVAGVCVYVGRPLYSVKIWQDGKVKCNLVIRHLVKIFTMLSASIHLCNMWTKTYVIVRTKQRANMIMVKCMYIHNLNMWI